MVSPFAAPKVSPFGAFSGAPSAPAGSLSRQPPLTLDARRPRRRRETLGKPQALPLQIEVAFAKRIDALFDRLAAKARALATTRAAVTQDSAESERAPLVRGLEAELDFTVEEAAALVGKVANHNARQMRRSLRAARPDDERKSLALQIPELSPTRVAQHAARTVREVKRLASSMAERVAPVVAEAVSQGLRGEALASELTRRLGIEKAAAKRIAIGQVIRINSAITRERHEKLGITEYIWRATPDDHTRAWHRKLDKTRQRYGDPPMGGGGGPKDRGHPGSADVCRCQALPVLPEPTESVPPSSTTKAAAALSPALAPLSPSELLAQAPRLVRRAPKAVVEREATAAITRAVAGKSLDDLNAIPFTARDLADDASLAFLRADPFFRRTGNVADNFGSSTGGLPQIMIDASGRSYLSNGRHRLTVARELGLRQIMARVRRVGPRGGDRWEYVGMIRI